MQRRGLLGVLLQGRGISQGAALWEIIGGWGSQTLLGADHGKASCIS